MAQDLRLTTRMGLHLTQQQLRFVELLEMNAPELDDAVERELEDNPALEVSDPEEESERKEAERQPLYPRGAAERGEREVREFAPPDNSESLYDYLRTQLSQRTLSAEVEALGQYIIGNLDSNGYLNRPLESLVDDLMYSRGVDVPLALAEEAFEEVRSLDPAGVGALNLRDCLLLQLRRLPASSERDDAILILEEQFEAFSMRHSHKIVSALHLTRQRIDAANNLILTLNPKPGAAFGGAVETAAGIIVPDYIVSREDNELFITLNNRSPELSVGQSFAEAMRGMEARRGRPKRGTEFIRDRYKSAVDFINLIRQRQQTMRDIMTAIVSHQREYFETGDVYTMKPMMLKDIERLTGYDKSVISRATNNKYAAMPWGDVVPMRSFFSDTVTSPATGGDEDEGGDILTNRQIEAALRELVDGEDKKHPLSDEKLRRELELRGYDVSRRTVAKYRDRAGILVARLRREL